MGRKVTQGLPEFDPIAFLDSAKLKAEAPSTNVVKDESSLPEDEEPAPLLDLSSGKHSGDFHIKVEGDSSVCSVHAGMHCAMHASSCMYTAGFIATSPLLRPLLSQSCAWSLTGLHHICSSRQQQWGGIGRQ